MNNEDELIKLAKTRRAMGYSMWPGTCSKCGKSFEAGRHLVEDAKVYSYCNNCYDELEKLVRTGINDVFIQPERSKREDFKVMGLGLPDPYYNLPKDAVL